MGNLGSGSRLDSQKEMESVQSTWPRSGKKRGGGKGKIGNNESHHSGRLQPWHRDAGRDLDMLKGK